MIVDSHDLADLTHDLDDAGRDAVRKLLPVMHRGAANIRDDARENAPRSDVIKHYPRTISYDIERNGDTLEAEIGPDRDVNGQAKLAHIFEYGTDSLAPRPHLGPALDRELPKFEQFAAEAMSKGVVR